MASQPEDIFVRPSTSHEAEVCQTEEELIDDLQLQEILLESLRGTSQDTPEQRVEFLSTIKSIKGKLKKLRKQRGKALIFVSSRASIRLLFQWSIVDSTIPS